MEPKAKIYLATPDAALARSLRNALEGSGLRVQEAMDWGLIPEEVSIFGADVVLLASDVPGLAQNEALRKLKADLRTRDRAVIILFPERDVGAVEGALDLGADDVMAAPFVPAEVVTRVRLHAKARSQPDVLHLADVAHAVADEPVTEEAPARPRIAEGLPPGLDGYYEQDLAVLIEVSEALASSLPPLDSLFVLVRRIAHLIPVDRCNVVVRGVKENEVVVVASHDDPNLRERVVDVARYPEVRRCLQKGDVVLIEDVRKDPDMREVLDFIRSVDLRSALVLPLFVRETVVGTLSLTSRREIHGFTRRELLFVRTMANLAAGILTTTDLLRRVRRDATREKPSSEEIDEIVLGLEDQIEGLIEELERK